MKLDDNVIDNSCGFICTIDIYRIFIILKIKSELN